MKGKKHKKYQNEQAEVGMSDLAGLPNIGKIMEKRLARIGINDVETLMKTGSKEAFIKLRSVEGDTCFSALCGLEGAIQGIRWHKLSGETKKDLKTFFGSCK
jgi:DNA transformation protein